MSRANEPAYPVPGFKDDSAFNGLSVREHFAAMAMQSILTGAVARGCPCHEWTEQEMSVRVADALIAELAKAKP
jgi:hypothetical protein